MLVWQVMTGGVVSTTVTISVQVLLLPQQSVTSQVRRMTRSHAVPLVTVLSTVTMLLEPQQALKADGGSKFHLLPHCTVLAEEQSAGKHTVMRPMPLPRRVLLPSCNPRALVARPELANRAGSVIPPPSWMLPMLEADRKS